ncbi:hypothetical protein MBM09_10120 [Flaviramulus sp. BrNp1-15]|uniref:hypothetical protein n=1 Tax=Flaviramulus sp. BrNp1-15 TaxID=2916754 RepID=UPI001EE873B2|nr:hypothetical protein [Flaviramulus sp. BrNp1-15]ULC58275.1 hypothetical protein MBM09_10120 [Flaviramulus sp. BrNp1-15]
MKKFLFKSLTFFLIVLGIISLILIKYGGYVDYFYEKFTTPKANSFILGDSRSMQGIQPKVFSDYYFSSNDYELPIMNYSFTISQIAYGPLYKESIKRKLNQNTKNGLFIITVNPWILSSREGYTEEKGEFFEANMPPHNMRFTTHNPNFEYLIKNFNYFHFKSIIRRSSKMHKDGWLEESNLPKDSIMLNSWKKNQIRLYSDFASKWKKSNFRLKSLEELIEYLDNYGDVVLLRMPIDEKLISIENEFWFNFDENIQSIASKMNVEYLNFVKNNKYKTYDGNHLDKYGGVDFTRDLCDSISSRLKK